MKNTVDQLRILFRVSSLEADIVRLRIFGRSQLRVSCGNLLSCSNFQFCGIGGIRLLLLALGISSFCAVNVTVYLIFVFCSSNLY